MVFVQNRIADAKVYVRPTAPPLLYRSYGPFIFQWRLRHHLPFLSITCVTSAIEFWRHLVTSAMNQDDKAWKIGSHCWQKVNKEAFFIF